MAHTGKPKFLALFALLVVRLSTAQPPCTLCPNGAVPRHIDRVYHLGWNTPISCRQRFQEVAAGNRDCWSSITWDNTFDWQSFCGCPGLEQPKFVCGNFCWDHVVDNNAKVPHYVSTDTSCPQFAAIHPFLLSKDSCGDGDLQEACCVNYSGASSFGWLLPTVVSAMVLMFGGLFY